MHNGWFVHAGSVQAGHVQAGSVQADGLSTQRIRPCGRLVQADGSSMRAATDSVLSDVT